MPATSDPDTQCVDVVIVGAGFGGLCAAIQLLAAGHRVVVLEKAQSVGGTWRENTYPGAACDVQSHLYSFSFAPKTDWTTRYAGWEEILAYIHQLVDRFDLAPHLRLGQEARRVQFDDPTGRWQVETVQGQRYDARAVVLATGPLHVPAMPALPGLDTFRGKRFHSARWDHSVALRGSRVVSIGTGASGIQYLPEIAPLVQSLRVFQRTPAWVIPRDNRPYSDSQRRRFAQLPATRVVHRSLLYWRNELRGTVMFAPRVARAAQRLVARLIAHQVKDRETAAMLTPDYTIGCKRVLVSNTYLPMFNRPNVQLVTAPVREVRAHSVVTTDGAEHPADVLIFGTGFVVDPREYMRDFHIVGRGGRRLNDDWRDGPQAYLGMTITGYPNLFQLVGPNTGLGHNSILFMIEAQVRYLVALLALAAERDAAHADVRPDVQEAYNQEVQENLKGTVWESGCASWYHTAEGRNIGLWPWSTWRYWLRTRRPDPADYVFGSPTL